MAKAIVHSDYGSEIPLDSEPQVELYQDKFPKEPRVEGVVRVLYLCEPPVIKPLHKKIRKFAHDFDYILTFDPWVLKRYPHAHKFVYGTTWADKAPAQREFSISSVIGTKRITVGHRMRQKFWKKSGKVRTPLKLFFSRQFAEDGVPLPAESLRLGEDKSVVFASRFHVAIENCRMPDYFTEKIMDCFVTETVPIYWGCTNIEEYFNPEGLIVCKSLGALIHACNNVTPDTYERMKPAIQENRERAQQYISVGDRLAEKLTELLGKRKQVSV